MIEVALLDFGMAREADALDGELAPKNGIVGFSSGGISYEFEWAMMLEDVTLIHVLKGSLSWKECVCVLLPETVVLSGVLSIPLPSLPTLE
jgi:hypothetical protein